MTLTLVSSDTEIKNERNHKCLLINLKNSLNSGKHNQCYPPPPFAVPLTCIVTAAGRKKVLFPAVNALKYIGKGSR